MKPKFLAYTQKDLTVMAVSIPLVVGLTNYLLLGEAYFANYGRLMGTTLVATIILSISWLLCGWVAVRLREKIPSYKHTLNRLVLSLTTFLAITVVLLSTLAISYHQLGWWQYPSNQGRFWNALLFGFLTNLVLTIIFEGIYVAENWQKSLQEAEELRKVNLQSQFESLKNQVNPHFLFNSLNSLSSLISDDPERAGVFLDELSKVYRYLLRNNESDLTDLTTELQFIRSYFHLLKTRYGDGIELDVAIHAQYETYLLPPLTLQLLVENAVKHNVILREQPLQIRIFTNQKGWLTVRNNRQEKNLQVPPSKIGLSNIATKYQLLNQPGVVINGDGDCFKVSIPLIKNAYP
ncbi:MAG: histidine kinase [Ferruginibacter sp.]|nr:histidine kinase [Cytophagales bacterium]